MPNTTANGAYEAVIADLKAEAARVEAKLRQLHETITTLRGRTVERRQVAPAIMSAVDETIASGFRTDQVNDIALRPPETLRRGDTTRIVLEAIRANPNKTPADIADIVAPRLGKPDVARARKLIHSIVSYLVTERKDVIKDATTGRLNLAQPR